MQDPKQAKILMIEDDDVHRQMYSMQFKQAGYTDFTAVESGQEGLKSMEEGLPDLLLLDIALEDMDGLEVLRKMRENEKLSGVPVIVLSNMRERDRGSEARQLGAIDYLLKAEFLPREIVARVEQWLISRSS